MQKQTAPPLATHQASGATNVNRTDLIKQATAILKGAGFDDMTGEKWDKQYRRNKRAKQKITIQRWRERTKRLGKFGAASPVRRPAMPEKTT
jgi:hypothetical protein